MATYYSTVSDAATTAQAYGRDMPCSPKSGRNVARAIKGMPVARAKAFLAEVVAIKTPVPFKVRVRKIHHRKGGMGSGKYPVQTAKCMLKVLESAEANAEYKGLDKERLVITHSTAYQGTVIQAYTPRAQGRATPHYNRLCNFEVIVTQAEGEEPHKADAKSAKDKAAKKESKAAKAGKSDKAKHERHAKEHGKETQAEKAEAKAEKADRAARKEEA
jgi:large subunit ribosomal protein L22